MELAATGTRLLRRDILSARARSASGETGFLQRRTWRSGHTQQDDQQQTGSNAKGGEESNSHNASFTLDVQFVRKLFTNQSSIEQLSDSRCFSCNSIGVRAVRQLWPYEFMATRFRANQQGKPFPASEHLTFPASADLPGCI